MVHGISPTGEVVIRKALRRSQMLPFFEKLPPCLVGPGEFVAAFADFPLASMTAAPQVNAEARPSRNLLGRLAQELTISPVMQHGSPRGAGRMGGWGVEWLSNLSVLGISLAILLVMLISFFAGHRLQRARMAQSNAVDEPNDLSNAQEEYLLGGILALLGLLLAFTFGLALNRYEERRQLVTDEANAIGTAYLRAQLLDEPHRSRLSKLLLVYTENRILLANSAGEVKADLARHERLVTGIWASVSAARESALARGISMPVLDAFNEVINLDTKREVAWRLRVPAGVLILLLAFLIVTAVELGYTVEGRRGKRAALTLFVLVALSLGVITDLNRASSGVIRDSQWPMVMLQQQLRKQSRQEFDRFRTSPPAAENPSQVR
ncbi:MAG: hypothetical protein EOP21_05465 [Hyphomicrobiales bacterium]|nr:MAG: hypothetical protein EOP21_05465 [Hyphomicrobiales bacterium]